MEKIKDLRRFLSDLEKAGQLAYLERQVDPKHEAAAVMLRAALAGGPALFFKRVKGHKLPMVANTCASRARVALALGTTGSDLRSVYRKRIENPLPVEMVKEGPCQEVVAEEVDLGQLPIITAHEYDRGPYITSAVVIARNPGTGVRNASLHRVFPTGKDRAVIFMQPSGDLRACWEAAQGHPLPVALAIGLHPCFLFAAAMKFPASVDELEVIGSLRQQPVKLVKCKALDLEVPASAEIVLEGEIFPDLYDYEGPFGEYPGYYGAGTRQPALSPVINFKAMTTRHNPIYYALITGPTLGYEDTYFSCLAKEAVVFSATKGVCDAVKGVSILLSRYMAVVQLERRFRLGDIGLVMAAAFRTLHYIKYVVTVDEDVDIDDSSDIFWALSTRVDPTKDIYIFPKQRAPDLDPSTSEMCDKIGIDATVPRGQEHGFIRTRIPGFENVRLEEYISHLI